MSNSIGAASKYLAKKLDEAYKAAAKSAILDINPAFVREADLAGTFYLPKITLVGLGDYSTSTGYATGDATLEWGSYTYAKDRGRKFVIDSVEDQEGALVMFANVADQFMKQHVVPEIDAYRFAKIATDNGHDASGALSTVDGLHDALNVAMNTLDEAQVDDGNKILFITPTLARLHRSEAKSSTDSATDAFEKCTVVEVPASRFYETCTTNAGSDASAGGFTNAGAALNFIVMDKFAAFADAKHQAVRIFTPQEYQDANAWAFDYRIVHDCWTYSNKTSGIYVHTVS